MPRNQITIDGLDALKKEGKQLSMALSRTIAHYCADKLTEAAKKTLRDYYADYDPIEYSRYNKVHPGERTFQLINSAQRIYDNSNRFACQGGVRFAYETLHYPNKGADPLKTTESFWDGWHGGWCPMRSYVPGLALRKYGKRLVKDICHGAIGSSLIADAASSAGLSLISLG